MKEYVTFDIALELEKIGLEDVKYYFGVFDRNDKALIINMRISMLSVRKNYLRAPLIQQALEFFRDKYQLSCKIDDFYTDGKLRYDFSISKLGSQEDNPQGKFESYIDAELEAIKEMIKIVNLLKT